MGAGWAEWLWGYRPMAQPDRHVIQVDARACASNLVGAEDEVGVRAPLSPVVNRSVHRIPQSELEFNPSSRVIWRDFSPRSYRSRTSPSSESPVLGVVELVPERQHKEKSPLAGGSWWAGKDLNLRRLSQRIYSPPPLATWVPAQEPRTIIPILGEMSTHELRFAPQEQAPGVAQVFRQTSPGIGTHCLAPKLAGPQVEAPVGFVPFAHD